MFKFTDHLWLSWYVCVCMCNTAGRGSGTPCLDVFITLLSLGQTKYKRLCTQRKVKSCVDTYVRSTCITQFF